MISRLYRFETFFQIFSALLYSTPTDLNLSRWLTFQPFLPSLPNHLQMAVVLMCSWISASMRLLITRISKIIQVSELTDFSNYVFINSTPHALLMERSEIRIINLKRKIWFSEWSILWCEKMHTRKNASAEVGLIVIATISWVWVYSFEGLIESVKSWHGTVSFNSLALITNVI